MLFFKRKISKLSDEELLIHYTKSGDTEYFGELYNRYIPLLYGLCLKYLHDEDRAQEAVMQLFEDLLPKLGNYEIKVFKPWLYRVPFAWFWHLKDIWRMIIFVVMRIL